MPVRDAIMKPETIALHTGYAPDEQHAVAVPIHQTTSFAFDNAQHAADLFDLKEVGNIYSLFKRCQWNSSNHRAWWMSIQWLP